MEIFILCCLIAFVIGLCIYFGFFHDVEVVDTEDPATWKIEIRPQLEFEPTQGGGQQTVYYSRLVDSEGIVRQSLGTRLTTEEALAYAQGQRTYLAADYAQTQIPWQRIDD